MTESNQPAYLIFDAESVPDGVLLQKVRYPRESLSPAEAVERTRTEIVEETGGRSHFIPVSFCFPVAVCVARLRADYSLEAITCLDEPAFRPREITADFWRGVSHYRSTLVSYNGRRFHLPLLELAAFRWGISAPNHFGDRYGRRYRYGSAHLDLADWISNHGASHPAGGLPLLSKLLGKPGDLKHRSETIWQAYEEGDIAAINQSCMVQVLDTYFVFLRTRVMTSEMDLETEQHLVDRAKSWIEAQVPRFSHLEAYLQNWGSWSPWI